MGGDLMQLYAVTNGETEETKLINTILAIAPFVDHIILREKQKSRFEYSQFVQELINSGAPKEVLCVHTHVKIPFLTGVNQLHMPEYCTNIGEIKRLFPSLRVGRSVHSLEAAKYAENNGADYVMFGHIYQTDSKPGIKPRGLYQLEQIIHAITIPVIAIGGITGDRVSDFKDIGVTGVAVMSGIFSASCPKTAAMSLRKEVEKIEGSL